MRKLVYVGYYIDDCEFESLIESGVDSSRARQNFESRLLHEFNSILEPDEWEIVSYVPTKKNDKNNIGKSFLGEKKFQIFKIARNPISCLKSFFAFLKYIKTNDIRNCVVLMYSVHPVLSLPLFIKRKKRNLQIITICSEIPKYRPAGNKIKLPRKFEILLQTFLNKRMDAYVLFSKPMIDVIPVKNKPYIVMEGIAPSQCEHPFDYKDNIVMYAGGFGKQNNIELLIDACEKSKYVSELWLCGSGEQINQIETRVNSSKKAKYLGNLQNIDVIRLERKAKILVNLRDPSVPVTKYAFPSKILEYLASGSVVVSTKLEGIPSEYFEYIVPIIDLSIDGITECINSVLMLSDEEYIKKCLAGQKFVFFNKNIYFV